MASPADPAELPDQVPISRASGCQCSGVGSAAPAGLMTKSVTSRNAAMRITRCLPSDQRQPTAILVPRVSNASSNASGGLVQSWHRPRWAPARLTAPQPLIRASRTSHIWSSATRCRRVRSRADGIGLRRLEDTTWRRHLKPGARTALIPSAPRRGIVADTVKSFGTIRADTVRPRTLADSLGPFGGARRVEMPQRRNQRTGQCGSFCDTSASDRYGP